MIRKQQVKRASVLSICFNHPTIETTDQHGQGSTTIFGTRYQGVEEAHQECIRTFGRQDDGCLNGSFSGRLPTPVYVTTVQLSLYIKPFSWALGSRVTAMFSQSAHPNHLGEFALLLGEICRFVGLYSHLDVLPATINKWFTTKSGCSYGPLPVIK